MKEDVERTKQQAEDFKKQYGEYPAMPIKVSFKFGTMDGVVLAELVPTRFGYMIQSGMGMWGAGEDFVSQLKFLKDQKERVFPGVSQEEADDKGKKVVY